MRPDAARRSPVQCPITCLGLVAFMRRNTMHMLTAHRTPHTASFAIAIASQRHVTIIIVVVVAVATITAVPVASSPLLHLLQACQQVTQLVLIVLRRAIQGVNSGRAVGKRRLAHVPPVPAPRYPPRRRRLRACSSA